MTETATQTQNSWQEITHAVVAWWETVNDNHGDRAELRRCRSPAEVAFVPAFYRLKITTLQKLDPKRLAAVAGVLSHVEITPGAGERVTIAELFARPDEGGSVPRISEPRFRRLLRVADDDYTELYPMLTRMIRQIKRKVPIPAIPSLIWGVYRWDQKTKRAWAEAYYEHIPQKKD
jgi:CRISPR system Cascade subunit CasB